MYNRNYEVNMDSVAAYLADAVNKVKTQENPDVLNKIKKVFKKTVIKLEVKWSDKPVNKI